jgi:hypothetical protein
MISEVGVKLWMACAANAIFQQKSDIASIDTGNTGTASIHLVQAVETA